MPWCPPVPAEGEEGERALVCVELWPTAMLWLWLWLAPVRKCPWATNFAPNQ